MSDTEKTTPKKKRKEFRLAETVVALTQRLSRIEGQVRGLKRMLEDDSYCPDVLIQISAVTAALNSFGKELLVDHLKNFVSDEIRAGNTETIDELVVTLNKMLK